MKNPQEDGSRKTVEALGLTKPILVCMLCPSFLATVLPMSSQTPPRQELLRIWVMTCVHN